jgi:copper chaperone CopZ
VLVLGLLVSWSPAQPPQGVGTKISLTKLHCNGCVKKLTNQLMQVPGVETVQGDLPTATLFVRHKAGMNPSPRGMWEAVLHADHTPTRMEGPGGVFAQKPPQ